MAAPRFTERIILPRREAPDRPFAVLKNVSDSFLDSLKVSENNMTVTIQPSPRDKKPQPVLFDLGNGRHFKFFLHKLGKGESNCKVLKYNAMFQTIGDVQNKMLQESTLTVSQAVRKAEDARIKDNANTSKVFEPAGKSPSGLKRPRAPSTEESDFNTISIKKKSSSGGLILAVPKRARDAVRGAAKSSKTSPPSKKMRLSNGLSGKRAVIGESLRNFDLGFYFTDKDQPEDFNEIVSHSKYRFLRKRYEETYEEYETLYGEIKKNASHFESLLRHYKNADNIEDKESISESFRDLHQERETIVKRMRKKYLVLDKEIGNLARVLQNYEEKTKVT